MNTRHFGIKTPPLRKSQIFGRGGGVLLVHFSILENLPGFYSFQNPRTKFGRAFIYSKKIGRFAVGFIFGVFFIRKSPLITPISQNFSRASRAGSYLSQFFFARFARGFLFFSIFPKWPWVFILSNFDFLRNRSGFLFKGGGNSYVPGSCSFYT